MKRFFSVIFFAFLLNFSFAESLFVCLGSFKNFSNAERLVKNLTEMNEKAFISKAEVKGQTMYRVLLSKEFEYKDDALSFKESIKDSEFARKFNLEGLWICQDEQKKEEIVLQKNENKIPVSEEKPYSVLVHSYKEEQAAENGKKRLKENDIDSYVLKTFDDSTYFSFDLHSGAFESEEEAEPLMQHLEEIGIKGAEISDYSEEKEKIKKYDELVKTHSVVFDNGNTEIPELYSEDVEKLIKEFPISKNFSLESLMIFDFDNIRKKEGELPALDDFYSFVADAEKIHAASFGLYRDELFNKDVMIYISSADENAFYDISSIKDRLSEIEGNKENNLEISEADFLLKDGILKSLVMQTDGGNVFYGVNEKKDLAVFMTTESFSQKDFYDFINNFENDSSLLIYPQVRRTLLVLPESTDTQRDFLTFTLNKVEPSYAVSKGYALWSFPIVGHWNAEALLFEKNKNVSVGFFDLDYDYNAKRVHEMFMKSHEVNEDSHSSFVKNAPSWYVNLFGNQNEVSFSTKSYIIAVNGYDNSTEEDLVKLSDELLIWNK